MNESVSVAIVSLRSEECSVSPAMIFTEARSLQSICGKEVSQEELDLLDQSERAVEPEVYRVKSVLSFTPILI